MVNRLDGCIIEERERNKRLYRDDELVTSFSSIVSVRIQKEEIFIFFVSLKFSKNTRFAFLFFQQMMHSIEVERERVKKKSKYDYPNDSPSLFFVLRLLISFNREIFEQLPRRLLLNQQWTFIVSLKKHTEQCHATNIERLRRRRIFKIDKI